MGEAYSDDKLKTRRKIVRLMAVTLSESSGTSFSDYGESFGIHPLGSVESPLVVNVRENTIFVKQPFFLATALRYQMLYSAKTGEKFVVTESYRPG